MSAYQPKDYWEKRLKENFSLKGVGNFSYSSRYNYWIYKNNAAFLTKALSTLNIDPEGACVCDLGCGTGFYVDYYHNRGAENITGVDITNASVSSLAEKYPDYTFIQEGVDSVSLIEKAGLEFDIVNAFGILYHIVDEVLFEKAIENISKLTKETGYIVISDFFQDETKASTEHVVHRSLKVYEDAFRKHGIKIVAMYPYSWIINRPLFRSLLTPRFINIATALDELFVPVYYFINKMFVSNTRSNLKIVVARRNGK
jgi:SAM-dependent methyltransferase